MENTIKSANPIELSPKCFSLKSNSQTVEKVPVGHIKPPNNPVKPPSPTAIALCKGNMDRYGQPRPILVSDDFTVIEGLEFLVAAQELGWTHINIIRLSGLSEQDAKVLTLALAKLPHLSDWDEEALRIEVTDIVTFDPELIDLTGFSMGEIDLLLDPATTEDKLDPLDELPEPPTDGETVSSLGDIFLLGENRILCGDSQKQGTFDLLMDGDKARAIVTDPPYNIPIANNVSGLGKKKHGNFAMAVGEMSFVEFTTFLRAMFLLCTRCLVAGGLIYVFMDRRHLEELFAAARTTDLKIFDFAIWDKGSGGMGGVYRSQLEPCGVFKFGNHPHLNNVELGKHGRYRTNLWRHRGLSSFGKGRAEALALHPTIKPINLLAEIIKDCTKRGDIILDPFVGAGSTILAAQKTGRRCFGIELEPKFVDVAIRRWEAMSGQQTVHLKSQLTFAELYKQRRDASPTGYPVTSISTAEADNAQ